MGRTKQLKIPAVVAAALLAILVIHTPAWAQTPVPGAVANQPGATLLLPYFEVDLTNSTIKGDTTTFSVVNTSAAPILNHVVLYTDLGVPVLNYDVFLTGYGVYRLNLQNLLELGTFGAMTAPTATVGADSDPVGSFPSCNGKFPHSNLNASQMTGLQRALTGQSSTLLSGECGGQNIGDHIARGYITVDTVNSCSTDMPDTSGYFVTGGTGVASNQNVLIGDSFYLNPALNRAVSMPLVTLIADATNPATNTSGKYTFYGKYDSFDAADNRQPTSDISFTRYILGNSSQGQNFVTGGTKAVAWRDNKTDQGPFTCGTNPPWYPLNQEGIAVFDEQEQIQEPAVCERQPCVQNPPVTPFPAATNKTVVGGSAFPVSFNAGILYLDLNNTISGNSNPPVDSAAEQAWTLSLFDQSTNSNSWEMGERGTLLDSAEAPQHFIPTNSYAPTN